MMQCPEISIVYYVRLAALLVLYDHFLKYMHPLQNSSALL